MISRARSIVVLTGAGISAESGIETFRAAEGRGPNIASTMLQLRKVLRETRSWCTSFITSADDSC